MNPLPNYGSINLSCKWQGRTEWPPETGESCYCYRASHVSLMLPQSKMSINIYPPSHLQERMSSPLAFTCQKYQGAPWTHPDELKMTIEKVRGMTVSLSFTREERLCRPPMSKEEKEEVLQKKERLRNLSQELFGQDLMKRWEECHPQRSSNEFKTQAFAATLPIELAAQLESGKHYVILIQGRNESHFPKISLIEKNSPD